MALILNIESATKVCSVGLAKDGEIIAIREHFGEYAHAEKLTVFVSEVIKEGGFLFSDLDAVAVSKGPGSYTGLRIGVSAAKGFAYALDIPVISVATLKQMALAANSKITDINCLLCPMIDARRMEVYCEVFDATLNSVEQISARIIDNASFSDLLKKNRTYFFGDGASKCKEVLSINSNAFFLDDIYPSARYMAPLANKSFENKEFEHTAWFEPFYLKDFHTTVPKNKI